MVAVFVWGLNFSTTALAAGPAAVDIGSAGNFVILSQSGITSTGSHASAVNGNIGSSPITAAAMNSVFCSEIVGVMYGVDAAYTGSGNQSCFAGNPPSANKTLVDNAVLAMGAAFTNAEGRATPDGTDLFGGNIGGQNFAPGLYKWNSNVSITTDVTLTGAATDVWIFQITGDLSIASGGSVPAGVKVLLSGGAQSSNIFWQVGGLTGATLGTYSTFNGIILSAKQIIMQTGAVFNGRALAQTQVTLDANPITVSAVPVATPAILRVIKIVVNNNDGTAIAGSFTLHVKTSGVDVAGSPASGTSPPGIAYSLTAGTYVISEDAAAAYTLTFSGDCDSSGNITLSAGADKTCTLTNDDIATVTPPSSSGVSRFGNISVVKIVINDNGGTKGISDFQLYVNSTPVESGESNIFPALDETYVITETPDPQYSSTFSGDCDINGHLTLSGRDNLFCIITNNDRVEGITTGSPSGVAPVPPLIEVVKIPSPLALPNGPGSVRYTYTLRNIGTVAVTNITMVEDTCSPLTRTSGDANANSILEVNEVWVYACSTSLMATHTNTVVATGWSNGLSTTDIASATVVVGALIDPPLIHVTKIPNRWILPVGGGVVTYLERITNPGVVPISNVRLADDKCSPVNYISGDKNYDVKLDAGESWIYTCRTVLAKTTTNTAVATGSANGISVRDFAIATVVVPIDPALIIPKLPNAGFAPSGSHQSIQESALRIAVPRSNDKTTLSQKSSIPKAAATSIPMLLTIPKIRVSAALEIVALTPNGEMDVPKNQNHVAWLKSGVLPGEIGTAVLTGHFGWKNGKPSVFDHLHKLSKGDSFQIRNDLGESTTFIVREIKQYSPNAVAPEVFSSNDGRAHLNLITCEGVWNDNLKSFTGRLVVFAERE